MAEVIQGAVNVIKAGSTVLTFGDIIDLYDREIIPNVRDAVPVAPETPPVRPGDIGRFKGLNRYSEQIAFAPES